MPKAGGCRSQGDEEGAVLPSATLPLVLGQVCFLCRSSWLKVSDFVGNYRWQMTPAIRDYRNGLLGFQQNGKKLCWTFCVLFG